MAVKLERKPEVMTTIRRIAGLILAGSLSLFVFCTTGAADVIVIDRDHPRASDNNPGSSDRPMRTISGAVKLMQAGDQCLIREGIYRETVEVTIDGTADEPVVFKAAEGDTVILSGTERLDAEWRRHRGEILVAETDLEFEQLFANGEMMIEARWPNTDLGRMLDRETWAYAEEGSQHGWMRDADLAESGLDASGAVAWLGVAHQFFSWSRKVSAHSPGEPEFRYPANLDGLGRWRTIEWPVQEGELAPRYILMGKLEFLDHPGEWHLDRDSGKLYFWPPEGTDPDQLVIEVKQRDLAFDVSGDHVEISGLSFFGSTFRYRDCSHGKVEQVHLVYPSYQRLFGSGGRSDRISATRMEGDQHSISNSSLSHSSVGGLALSGSDSTIEQCLVRDFCWTGSLRNTGIQAGGGEDSQGRARIFNNTVHHGGNSLISIGSTPDNRVSYNHIYDGGRASKDVSLLYTQAPGVRGTEFSYNWVHDCAAPHIALGIRGDDQTRGLIVHHNVVWNIAWEGIVVKGDHNLVYNNTCFNNDWNHDDYSDIMLYGTPEPEKPWRYPQWPLLEVQNKNTLAFNNVGTIRGNRTHNPVEFPGDAHHNTTAKGSDPEDLFVDLDQLDFRPVSGSPWIDAGTVPEGIRLDFHGEAPDLGAYEAGSEPWRAGCAPEVVQAAETAKTKVNQLLFE